MAIEFHYINNFIAKTIAQVSCILTSFLERVSNLSMSRWRQWWQLTIKSRHQTSFKEKRTRKSQVKLGLFSKFPQKYLPFTLCWYTCVFLLLTYVLQYTCFNKSLAYVRRQAKRCLHYYESATPQHFMMQGCVSDKVIVTRKSSFLPLTFKMYGRRTRNSRATSSSRRM